MIETIMLFAAAVTAIATSLSAFVSWQMWRGRLTVDWVYEWSERNGDRQLEIDMVVRNETASAVLAKTAKISGLPVRSAKSTIAKGEGWPTEVAPIFSAIAPGKSGRCSVFVLLDWPGAASARSRLLRRKRHVSLSTRLTVQSRSSNRSRRSFRSKINIPMELIERMATKVAV